MNFTIWKNDNGKVIIVNNALGNYVEYPKLVIHTFYANVWKAGGFKPIANFETFTQAIEALR